jgi:hypothetical protein
VNPLGTIRSRLLAGFGAVIVLLAVAGIVGRLSLTSLSGRIQSTLAASRREAQLTADITANVAQELSAGSRYLETPDTATQNAFRSYGFAAHRAQKELNASEGMNAEDIALVAAIDVKLSRTRRPPRPPRASRSRRCSRACSSSASGARARWRKLRRR